MAEIQPGTKDPPEVLNDAIVLAPLVVSCAVPCSHQGEPSQVIAETDSVVYCCLGVQDRADGGGSSPVPHRPGRHSCQKGQGELHQG